MNTSTAITLNDRFSLSMKKLKLPQQPPQQPQSQTMRGRSRSRSRSRGPTARGGRPSQRDASLRGSQRNRTLLNQLERQHKMRIALKLKNKSIMTTRGRVQGQQARNNMKRAAVIRKTMNPRNLRRANSMTTFVPLNDTPGRIGRGRSRSRGNGGMRGRSRSRSQSRNRGVSIQDRLGIPAGRRTRMRRGGARAGQQQKQANGAAQRSRSRSRVRLNRNNFRNGNPAPLRRSNSVNSRLGYNGPAPMAQNNQIRRRRMRSQSRGNNRNNNNNNNNNNNIKRTLTGRIAKRRVFRNQGVIKQIRQNPTGNAIRNGRKMKRGGQGASLGTRGGKQGLARGRARNRGQNNNQGQQQQQQQRRGRSRTRRGGGKGQVSKEQLDKQLDAYMAKGSA